MHPLRLQLFISVFHALLLRASEGGVEHEGDVRGQGRVNRLLTLGQRGVDVDLRLPLRFRDGHAKLRDIRGLLFLQLRRHVRAVV